MSDSPADRIAVALERIATILESGAHINIDHCHIENIDHFDHIENETPQKVINTAK